MKKPTKKKRPRQPRSPRVSRKKTRSPQERLPTFQDMLRETLLHEIQSAVSRTALQLVQDEVTELVGEPWSRKGDSPLRRNGHVSSTIFLDGEPHALQRPRVRDRERGEEFPLKTLAALQSRDALDEEVMGRMAIGVSTRNYDGALGSISEGLGLKKSAVSSAFKRASQKDLDTINGRCLAEWNFCVIYIDGTGFQKHTVVTAIGLEADGTKHVLGAIEGASENAEVVGGLLENLLERGLSTTGYVLFVLDGSKALRKAVLAAFGDRARIQRCILHKERNILSYLPESRQRETRRRLRAAWGASSYEEAKTELGKVKRWLEDFSESAAASLVEAFEDTLTVHRLGITGALRRTLITTNPIESTFSITKRHSARVKRWNGSSMVLRWIGAGLIKAEQQYRRVTGHAQMPLLIAALENESLTESAKLA